MTIHAPEFLPERSLVLVKHSAREYAPNVQGLIDVVKEMFEDV